jgi:hypothetical protein
MVKDLIDFKTMYVGQFYRGMRGKIKAFMYIFDQPFHEYNARKFILVNFIIIFFLYLFI